MSSTSGGGSTSESGAALHNKNWRRGRGKGSESSRGRCTTNSHQSNSKNVTFSRGGSNVPHSSRHYDMPIFGFKRLYKFLEMPAGEVLLSINRDKDDWQLLLKSDELNGEKLILIIEVLATKACEDDPILLQHKINILTACCSDIFVQKIVDVMSKICMGAGVARKRSLNSEFAVDSTPTKVMNNVYQICSFLIKTLPIIATDFCRTLIRNAMGASVDCDPTMQIFNKFKLLNDEIKELADQVEKKKERNNRRWRFDFKEEDLVDFDMDSPPESIKYIEIIPNIEELRLTSQPFLRPNKASGAYLDADHYIDVQFRLLREDFVRPIRDGIRTFLRERHDYITGKKRMPLGQLRLFTRVMIRNVVKERGHVAYKLQLSLASYRRIKWEKSKRLLPGSLVILTTTENCFQADNTHFGVVFGRDFKELENGIVTVLWEGTPPQYNESEEYLMFESEVYLEAYRHTLETLQSIELSKFPMKKFIVDASENVGFPKYLIEAAELHKVKLRHEGNNVIKGLDENQASAFATALTKEFSLIQGPPGTGKTFLGLKIAEVLLSNSKLWTGDEGNPITVVCYTNHALDQFLEGILAYYHRAKVPPEIIRIGGRSKSEAVVEFNLENVRRRNRNQLSIQYWRAERAAKEAVNSLEEERARGMSEIMGLQNLQGIVNFEKLSVWHSFKAEYPKKLWETFLNLSWFGIGNEQLKDEKLTEEMVAGILREWFSFRLFPNGIRVIERSIVTNVRKNVPDEDDFENEEDYDMDELYEHRIIDDILLEAETSTQSYRKEVAYLPASSIDSCISSRLHLNKTILEATQKMNNVDAEKFRKSKQDALLVLENRKEFLAQIFKFYRDHLLDLPDPTGVLKEISQLCPVVNRLQKFTMSERWSLYFAVVNQIRHKIAEKVAQTEKKLGDAQRELQQTKQWGDGLILRACKVVGLTTTGAAKYNNLLKMMKSKIVIVEEAAEIFEAHIVTCITENCEQLILIGDHRQLRPSPTVYKLATKYHLNLSLFERMLNNNLHCHRLKVQHRMRPEIAELIVGPIYDELHNHISVRLYPNMKGISKNVFFITHSEHESEESESTSKFNKHEAKFLASLCRHLILQGYNSEQITVLTMYTGQMFLLKKEIGLLEICRGIRVTCVDNFQGEENDIILLSLVRSNSEGKIGFLGIDNRICVSLSRAKHGLYIIGNMDGLVEKSETWVAVKEKLVANNSFGDSLELLCQNHFTRTVVRNDQELKNAAPEGGCTLPCDATLACTHKCRRFCHVIGNDHAHYKCREKCLKKCKNDLHPCKALCFEDCPRCTIKVEKTLKCELEHMTILSCYIPVEKVSCMEIVEKTLPCGHITEMACHINVHDYKCLVQVEKELPCHHKKQVECHIDPTSIRCRVQVEHTLPCSHNQTDDCWKNPENMHCNTMVNKKLDKCGHDQKIKCGDMNSPTICKSKCDIRLNCGHQCAKMCHAERDPDHNLYECRKDCARECQDGHKCIRHLCFEKCPPCNSKIIRLLPCGHEKKLICFVDVNTHKCLHLCQRILDSCNHKCQNLCFQPCGPCTVTVKKRGPCSHEQNVLCSNPALKENCVVKVRPINTPVCGHKATFVPCKDDGKSPEELVIFCNAPCDYKFCPAISGGCEHNCLGTCSSCLHGRLHMKCQANCGRQLVCGHVCDVPCSAVCPPCQKPCMMKCEHSVCKKKCGEPCSTCKEKCGWICVHKKCTKLCGDMCDREPCNEPCQKKLKCRHKCVGFCGEPCPPLCRICDREELTSFYLIGNETDDDARFVYLEDCNHTIEVEGLEGWLSTSENSAISAKTCPRCTTTIRNCKRFGNIIRQHYKDVVAVKMRAFGNKANCDRMHGKWMTILHSDIPMERVFVQLHKKLLNHLAKRIYLKHGVKLVKKPISEVAMQSLDFIADSANKIANDLFDLKNKGKLNENHYFRVVEVYRQTFSSMIDRHPLSSQEVHDFNGELDRLDYFKQLMLRRSLAACNPGNKRVYPTFEKAESLVMSRMPFTPERKQLFKLVVGELDELLKTGLGITDRERMSILRAIGEAQGHWFKCPNGHIYVISDCGGAMEESVCGEPGCNARIGGGNHQLRRDNALASEMDGAQVPAWRNTLQ